MTKMKFDYNKRRYIAENFNFRIEYDKQKKCIIPESFTKYYPLSVFNIDALLKNYIYASHPSQLNDPFDCFSELIDFSEIKEKVKRAFNHTNLPFNDEQIYNDLFQIIGIISMTSSKNENPILWAHYSNKHSGFSVTYNKDAFNKESIKGPFQIDYIKKQKKIIVTEQDRMAQIFCLTMTKSNYWSNENEWRYLHIIEKAGNENRKFNLPENSIKEIKLGFYFFDAINMNKISPIEFEVNLKNEKNLVLKKRILRHVKSKGIPLKIMVLGKNDFIFKAIEIDYEFDWETNYFKYKYIFS